MQIVRKRSRRKVKAMKPKITSDKGKNEYLLNLYKKETKGDNAYYWASVKGEDKDGESIYGSIFVRMSKKAREVFDDNAESTNNKRITRCYVRVTDHWLKAVPGQDHNSVILFVNSIEPVEDDE